MVQALLQLILLQKVAAAMNTDHVRNQMLIEHNILNEVYRKWRDLLESFRSESRQRRVDRLRNQRQQQFQPISTPRVNISKQTIIPSPPRVNSHQQTIIPSPPRVTIPKQTRIASPPRVNSINSKSTKNK